MASGSFASIPVSPPDFQDNLSMRFPSRRSAFTLIELLVVIAIIAILIGLLLPAIQKVREASARAKCQNNLKQLGLALHQFHDAYGGFPKAGKLTSQLSWHVFILPFIEQGNLYNQFDLSPGSFDGVNGTGPNKNIYAQNPIATFLCPSSSAPTMQLGGANNVDTPEMINGSIAPYTTHYYGVMGPVGTNPATGQAYNFDNSGASAGYGGFSKQGIFIRDTVSPNPNTGPDPGVRLTDVTDGSANTLLLGEMSWVNITTGTRYRSWVRGCDTTPVCAGARNVVNAINSPSIATYMDISFGSMHPNGANFAMADGSVRFIDENIALATYYTLASYNGGEATPDY
jgi:prepilin-type N-terminal cleavage/methylation domain-containing protein/prepilin-type processing-associated H-X9-DG protein